MEITHLYHSGILIEDSEVQIFIDAISDIGQHIDVHKSRYFLVSHAHRDHFDKGIFNYAGADVHYVLSDDILDHTSTSPVLVRPDKEYTFEHFSLKTYESTDCGVSFLINYKGKVFFHAGDLNWWHWENDSEQVQQEEELNFKRIVKKIDASWIDVAFIPCDPRLGEAMCWTIDYFLTVKNVNFLVPIHFRSHFELAQSIQMHAHGDSKIRCAIECDELLLSIE